MIVGESNELSLVFPSYLGYLRDKSRDLWTAVGSGSTATSVTVVTHKSGRAPAPLWSGAAMWTPPHALCPSYLSSLVTTAHLHLAYDTVVHHLQVDEQMYIHEHVHFSVQTFSQLNIYYAVSTYITHNTCTRIIWVHVHVCMFTSLHGVHAHGYTILNSPPCTKAHLHVQMYILKTNEFPFQGVD